MKVESGDKINNAFYDGLKDRWYVAKDDPIALLRAESRLRNPWVLRRMSELKGGSPLDALDVACGAGFLSNALASEGHEVVGVDLSTESLEVAGRQDATRTVQYLEMDALNLEFPNESFDVVCSMDFLEHTDRPARAIEEAARVLRPGGLFFFHTFNRNPLSGLVVIKGVEWFVKNTPKRMHVYDLFIKPSELRAIAQRSGLDVVEIKGVRPDFFSGAFARMLLTREVPEDLKFVFTSSTFSGYCGFARKTGRRLIPQ